MRRILSEEEHRERVEHTEMIEDMQIVLGTKAGKRLFKYLFKALNVGEMPELGLEGSLLMDYLGFHRAGHAVFKMASEADAKIAGELLAEKEKELYEAKLREANELDGRED